MQGLSIEGVRIAHNSFPNGKGTQAELSLTQTAAKTWAFDFCSKLVFPQIASVKYHVMADSGFPIAVVSSQPIRKQWPLLVIQNGIDGPILTDCVWLIVATGSEAGRVQRKETHTIQFACNVAVISRDCLHLRGDLDRSLEVLGRF